MSLDNQEERRFILPIVLEARMSKSLVPVDEQLLDKGHMLLQLMLASAEKSKQIRAEIEEETEGPNPHCTNSLSLELTQSLYYAIHSRGWRPQDYCPFEGLSTSQYGYTIN